MDNFTYSDISGKRRLRNYVWAVIVIGVIVAGLFGYAARQRSQVMAVANAQPQPLSVALAAPTEAPTATSLPPTPTQPACPTDPDDWNLVEVIPGDNYKRIEPTCVYEGLERTVAWSLAIRMGYSRAEANQALGFDEMPVFYGLPEDKKGNAYLSVLTNQKGPLQVRVFVSAEHPDFQFWNVDVNGNAVMSAQLRGCFYTSSFFGGKMEEWGNGFPVICVVTEDFVGDQRIGFMKLAEKEFWYKPEKPVVRYFAYYGYAGDNRWVSLGSNKDLIISDLKPAGLTDEYKLLSQFYQTPTWNAEWLEAAYGLSVRPLPENWQNASTDVAVRDEIGRAVIKWTDEYKKTLSQGKSTP